MTHEPFLTALREKVADRSAWLVYADWLDEQGDPTGLFVRLSLDLTAGQLAAGDAEARLTKYERLYPLAHPATRDLLAEYRSALPTRFRILDRIFIGEEPAQEIGGYARTAATGYLEAGRVALGMDLGVNTATGQPQPLRVIFLFMENITEMSAGREPIRATLGWWGHLPLEVGRVLTCRSATTSDKTTREGEPR